VKGKIQTGAADLDFAHLMAVAIKNTNLSCRAPRGNAAGIRDESPVKPRSKLSQNQLLLRASAEVV
jgi:hypothetical protein